MSDPSMTFYQDQHLAQEFRPPHGAGMYSHLISGQYAFNRSCTYWCGECLHDGTFTLNSLLIGSMVIIVSVLFIGYIGRENNADVA